MPRKLNNSDSSTSPVTPIKIPIHPRRPLARSNGADNRTSSPYTPELKAPLDPKEDESPDLKEINNDEQDQQPVRLVDPSPYRPSPVPFRYKTPGPPEKQGSCNWTILVAVIVAVIVCFVCFPSKTSDISRPDKIDCSKFMGLDKSFPNQDKKLFKSLKSGIEGTFNEKPPELSVFSLFSTDENLIENFMQEVIKVAKQCMNQSQDPISLTKEQLSVNMVEDYKEELAKRNIMIVSNIEEASPDTVRSLHAFCDTYNPLVAKSVIFLTIRVPRTPKGKPVEYITEFLNDRWKSLADNIRNPLITRMVDQTFFLKPFR